MRGRSYQKRLVRHSLVSFIFRTGGDEKSTPPVPRVSKFSLVYYFPYLLAVFATSHADQTEPQRQGIAIV